MPQHTSGRISPQVAMAVEKAYRAHGRVLLGYATRLLIDGSTAEDVVIESFTRGMNRVATRGGEISVELLFGIARLVCKEFNRQTLRAPLGNFERKDGVPEAVDQQPMPGDQLSREEACRRLRVCVQQLASEERSIVVLFYFDDLAISDIAKLLNMPVNTVKVKLHRSRLHLKALYNSITKVRP